jgi:hypothetical protein
MSMPVHVAMVIGGLGVNIVPHTIRYYQSLGIRSFFLIIHVPQPDDPFVAHVSSLAASCGVAIDSVEIDPHFPSCKERAFARVMEARPDDWFLAIDGDEFHRYPSELFSVLDHCEREGYEYVRGCLVDRLSADGTLTPLRPDESIWTQYPLGSFLTYPLVRADPRKVVAAKGRVVFRSAGHHDTLTGVGCPGRELFVPVHHFKWVDTLVPYLEDRRELFKRMKNPYWGESDRCLAYLQRHGRIDLDDPRLLVAPCNPEYPLWDRVSQMVFEARDDT